MGLDGSKGEKIRAAIEQFGKNLKRDIATSSPFDKTKNGFVTKVTPIGYTVRIENKEYPNVQAIDGATIRVGDVVVCQLPNNQMSQMYIIGKKVNLTNGTGGGGDLTDVTLNGISVVSEGVARLIADTTPTSGSSHLITSGGVYTALQGKQDTLSFDDVPTSGSNNPVKSGGVYNATFSMVYRSLADLSLLLSSSSTLAEICNAFTVNNSIAILDPYNNANLAPSNAESSVGLTIITCRTPNRITVEYTSNKGERWLCGYHKDSATLYPWKKVAKTDDLSDYVTLATDQTISGKKAFTANKTYMNRVEITNTNDVSGDTDTTETAPLLIGAKEGQHLELDGNEITSKSNKTTPTDLHLNMNGGDVAVGANIPWVSMESKGANLRLRGNLLNYGANCERGVDGGTNYDGYFRLATATIPNWYRGAKALIYVQDIDSADWGILQVMPWVASDGNTSASRIIVTAGEATGDFRNKFFLVVRQKKTVNASTKFLELWYKPSGTYQRITATFLSEIADTRNADPVAQKWVKYTRTSSVEQGYVSAGVVDLTNGFVPTASWGTVAFATTDYPDVDIYSDNGQVQFVGQWFATKNTNNAYSDTPDSASNRAVYFYDKNYTDISGINAAIGKSWNALNFYLRSKSNVTRNLEFVHYPSTDTWNFDCTTDNSVNLGTTTRRWKNLYVAGALNDGSKSQSVENIIDGVAVCETVGSTAAKVVTLSDYTLRNGNMISIYFKYANSVANPTLNINGTGAKPIFVDYAAATTSNLTAGWHTFYYNGTNYYTGTWFDGLNVAYANGTPQIRQNTNIVAGEAITANKLIYAKDDNKYYVLGASSAINTILPILYANSAISSGSTGSNNWSIRNQSSSNMLGASTVTAYAPVFLKGVLTGHTFTLPSSNWWTQTIPTTEDGFQYMLLGYAYTTSNIRLYDKHPIYGYIAGAFQPYTYPENVAPVSQTYPTSSAMASTQNVLSEKAVYDGVAERTIICDTAGGTSPKTITVPNFTLKAGIMLFVYFKNTNTYAGAKLQVNGGAEKSIYVDNSAVTNSNLEAGWHTLYYNGTNWYTGTTLPVWNTSSSVYTRYIRYQSTIVAGGSITSGKIGYAQNDNKYYQIGASASINLLQPLLYIGSTMSANGTSTNNYKSCDYINIASAVVSGTYTQYASLFLKGVLTGHTFTLASSDWCTTTIPTSEDGFQYLYLGYCVTATTFRLSEEHKVYAYQDGAFSEYSEPIVGLFYKLHGSFTISSGSFYTYTWAWNDDGIYLVVPDSYIQISSNEGLTFSYIKMDGTLGTDTNLMAQKEQPIEIQLSSASTRPLMRITLKTNDRYREGLTQPTAYLYRDSLSASPTLEFYRPSSGSSSSTTVRIYKLQ